MCLHSGLGVGWGCSRQWSGKLCMEWPGIFLFLRALKWSQLKINTYNYLQSHFVNQLSLTHPPFILFSYASFQSMLNLVLEFFSKVAGAKLFASGKVSLNQPWRKRRRKYRWENRSDGNISESEPKISLCPGGEGRMCRRRKSVIDSSSWGGLSDQRGQW